VNVLLEQSLSFNFIIFAARAQEKEKEAALCLQTTYLSFLFFHLHPRPFCVPEVLQHRALSLSLQMHKRPCNLHRTLFTASALQTHS
jgi:hypothetical protein